MGGLICRNNGGFVVLLGVRPGDCTSYTTFSDTFSGALVRDRGDPRPVEEEANGWVEVSGPVLPRRKSIGDYLVHRVDNGLGVVPTEAPDRLNLIVVRENDFNQGDKFTLGNFLADQMFPRSTCEKPFRLMQA